MRVVLRVSLGIKKPRPVLGRARRGRIGHVARCVTLLPLPFHYGLGTFPVVATGSGPCRRRRCGCLRRAGSGENLRFRVARRDFSPGRNLLLSSLRRFRRVTLCEVSGILILILSEVALRRLGAFAAASPAIGEVLSPLRPSGRLYQGDSSRRIWKFTARWLRPPARMTFRVVQSRFLVPWVCAFSSRALASGCASSRRGWKGPRACGRRPAVTSGRLASPDMLVRSPLA